VGRCVTPGGVRFLKDASPGGWGALVWFEVMPNDHEACAKSRKYVRVRRVDECDTLDELFIHCLPAFGAAYLRRIYQILDRAHADFAIARRCGGGVRAIAPP